MPPRLLPTLCLLSLACSAAMAVLWVVSWWRVGYAEYVNLDAPWRFAVSCTDGVGMWMWRSGGSGGYGADGFRAYTGDPDVMRMGRGPDVRAAVIGFAVMRGPIGRSRATLVQFPLWPAILLTAVPPAAWAWRRRKRGARGFEIAGCAAQQAEQSG